MVGVKISTNIGGWVVELMYCMGALYLWRSGLKPGATEPHGVISRSIRVVGAILLSALALYVLGYGLGFYGPLSK